jgi:hypothetical protein
MTSIDHREFVVLAPAVMCDWWHAVLCWQLCSRTCRTIVEGLNFRDWVLLTKLNCSVTMHSMGSSRGGLLALAAVFASLLAVEATWVWRVSAIRILNQARALCASSARVCCEPVQRAVFC